MAIIAVAYAYFSKPIYEARVYLIPPTQNGIADFNYGRVRESELLPFSVKDVYDVFLRNLQAESLRRKFFEEYYLPSIGQVGQRSSRDALYKKYSSELNIEQASKESSDRLVLSIQSDDPAKATEWVKAYVEKAGAAAKEEMIKNVNREAEVRARNIGQQINTLRESGELIRGDRIIQLREALRIAQAIGLEKPPIISENLSTEVSAGMDGQLTYMRGTKALEAEIKNLEQRKSSDPFIESLRKLQVKYSFYKNLEVNPENVSVYRMDGAVELPDSPIKPKKAIIVIVGFVAGGFLAVLIALLRYFYRRGRQ